MLKRYWAPVTITGCAIALSACVSILPEPVIPDALYAIEARETPLPLAANVVVREAEAPKASAGQAIVSEDASGALRLLPSVEWAGPATRQFQLAVVNSFAGGEGAAVLPEAGIAAPYEVSLRVQYLGLRGDRAVCRVSTQLVHTRRRALVGNDVVSVDVASTDGSTAARGAAMKSVTEQCISDISETIAAQVTAAILLDAN